MLERLRRQRSFPAIASLLLLAACADVSDAAASATDPDAGLIAWSDPIPDGLTVTDAAVAPLPFAPVEPSNLGLAEKVVATPEGTTLEEQAIIWVFDHPTFGLFWVSEQLADPGASQAEYENLASQPEEGCSEEATPNSDEAFGEGSGPAIVCYFGHHRFAKLSDGTPVFVTSGENTTAVHWFEELAPADIKALPEDMKQAAIEVVVIGPSSTLTEGDALAAADLI